MSHLLDEILAQAANGSPTTAALSSESVAVLLFASEFLGFRANWIDKGVDPLDEVTDADWDEIEKLVGNVYEEIMHPVLAVGSLQMWMTGTPPENWLICDGQAVSRDSYAELFALWGVTFGSGDGATTFNIPDLTDRSPMGAGGLLVPSVGDTNGAAAVALTINQLPAHDHDFAQVAHSHSVTDPGHTHPIQRYSGSTGTGITRSVWQVNANAATPAPATDSNTTGISISSALAGITFHGQGANAQHDNVHPVIGVNYIVYAVQ